MSKAFFISDAHLGFHDPHREKEKTEMFLDFLSHISEKGNRLFILGDFFDFWFEYKSAIPRHYFSVVCALEKLVRQGVSVHYATGNHDFGVGDFMHDELGVHVHKDPTEIELHGKRLFIGHGDGFIKRDIGGRLMKILLRNPVSQGLYRLLHPDLGFRLANFFSKMSRNNKEVKDRDAEYLQCAQHLFSRGIDFVVLGHTHRPFEFIQDGRAYVNTGDWMEHFTYAKLENDRLTLEYWNRRQGARSSPNPPIQKG